MIVKVHTTYVLLFYLQWVFHLKCCNVFSIKEVVDLKTHIIFINKLNSSLKSNTKFGINLLYFWLSLLKIPQSEVLYALHTVTHSPLTITIMLTLWMETSMTSVFENQYRLYKIRIFMPKSAQVWRKFDIFELEECRGDKNGQVQIFQVMFWVKNWLDGK